MEFDADDFRKHFPEFSNVGIWPDGRLEMMFEEATCYVWPCPWSGLNGKCQKLAVYLMVAHLAQLMANAAKATSCKNQQGGIITSATINKISVSVLAPPVDNGWQYWLAQTPYGMRLWALLRAKSRGGFYVGGWPERRGFRKAGGVF